MRVKISKKEREKLFWAVIKNYGSINNFLKKLKVHPRTFNDWRKGISTIPLEKFNNFIKILNFEQKEFSPKIFVDHWQLKKARKKGGLATIKKYGNPGTAEGRKKGGFASLITHKKNNTLFNNIKSIKKSRRTEKLAEFFGILFGDGHLSKYQVIISTSSRTDKEHALYTRKLISDLFDMKSYLKIKKDENTVEIVASSRNLVKFLNKNGMPVGNKIKNNLKVPSWIKDNNLYIRGFIRGLFDTDGCIYLDIHKLNGKIYKHLGWTITSYADSLILDIIDLLKYLNFNPTNRATQKSVYLRRRDEIKRYFKEIKTSNPKHYNRFKKFIGEVPKWS